MDSDESKVRDPRLNGNSAAQRAEERELILRSRKGDRGAFGKLVSSCMKRAYFAALGFLGSHEDALDISQEAFARAFDSADKLDPDRPFYPWVYQIVRRLSFNHLRDARNRGEKIRQATGWMVDDAGSRSELLSPAAEVERNELHQRLHEAMAELSESEREMLVLKEFEDLKYREIAELLDIPIGTVMSRLYSARKALAAKMEGVL